MTTTPTSYRPAQIILHWVVFARHLGAMAFQRADETHH